MVCPTGPIFCKVMRKSFCLFLYTCLLCLPCFGHAQLYQTVRGKLTDQLTDEPLPGAVVTLILDGNTKKQSTVVDASGVFRFDKVPLGRCSLNARCVGYRPVSLSNLLLRSGKELVLEIKMEEQVTQLSELIIAPRPDKEKVQNTFASASARSFTVEETERYAGSLGDPSRMVANYAGVMAVDDSRNDIIIRGNSPTGLLWRLEGVDIPSPNHFSTDGATGGPVSMINNNLLANSDFYTGAFPADYGNALAGVFDLRLRNGNNRTYEYLGQIGFGGFELGAEGPFSKNDPASFIVNYRYSTLAVFDLLGLKFDFGTGGAIPKYQDLNFKINVPTRRAGRFVLFGLGGLSEISMKGAERDEDLETVLKDVDLYNASKTGILGLEHTYYFGNEAKLITKLSTTGVLRETKIDSLRKEGTEMNWRWYASRMLQLRHSLSMEYRKKFDLKNHLSVGLKSSLVQYHYLDSVYHKQKYVRQLDDEGTYYLSQAHASWQHKFSDRLRLNTGLHALHFSLNNEWALEPRLGLRWQMDRRQTWSVASGLHSQTQIPSIYFYKDPDTHQQIYKGLGFNKAWHAVLGYDVKLATDFRVKAETYYQYLFHIPVSEHVTPQFSLINTGDDFYVEGREDMVNKGKGRNYGIELTAEKFLSHSYYFLATLSLFDSKYADANGHSRNTKFNGKYVFNLLGGYEWSFNAASSLLFDIKGVWAGGKWQVPIDVPASKADEKVRYDWANAYTQQAPDYFKINLRITYKLNGHSSSQEWALDLQNLTNHKNVFMEDWDADRQEKKIKYQQGFFPMLTYRILF